MPEKSNPPITERPPEPPEPSKEPIPILAENINQKPSLDSNILAYIDHSLKSLIGTNLNNNNSLNQMIQPPLLPTVMNLLANRQTILFFSFKRCISN